ncbi:R3H-associated N-terminal domain-containing protein [Talaromyces proteolyticus]|uniref:R3H-associated N-terminal domain-containing protein n=1 Tax=Talaromyces proteolyticus TaxID=1131652 RepID=A0AAD4KG53_9EURO|nr:R3H-associated N-terminal domain-containing protein [Talaromyces proteolyticus]KAH8690896.1 R3H-associated N-terminal domain-containing protein [Talaromyces proteolyticus]
MAIHPTVPRDPSRVTSLTGQRALDISAWTEETAASLESLDISDSTAEIHISLDPPSSSALRGTSTPLSIPLDDPIATKAENSPPRVKIIGKPQEENDSSTYHRREPIRRDSLKRRESLLKGKEGSRRRQRWENDRLLTNPWAQPPAPSDWFVQPTHTRHDPLPYYLAPLWDTHFAYKEDSKSSSHTKGDKNNGDEKSRVSKEVRQSLKHARAARGMLQDLEEDIRQFLEKWNERQLQLREGSPATESDFEDSDEEIVFVGRNGQMYDAPTRKVPSQRLDEGEEDGEKMVFESLAHDRGAVFGRWLVHSIATYYGLYTWSVTAGNPARRKAYVGLHPPSTKEQISFPSGQPVACGASLSIKPGEPLPKPLWGQV